ncbi:MAG: Sensory box histidine kinase/response regulator [Nitrospirae bacterium]|nr:MAG: Sensory box histidine kinase/response regulator [Nitrospirota bacterium]
MTERLKWMKKKETRKSNKTRKSKPEPKGIAALRKKAEKRLKKQTDRLDELSEKDVRQLAHELGTHQIELEMQNEELRRAQNELEASRSKYSDLYDFSPIGYFTFNKNGLILEVNLTGANLLGVSRSNLFNRLFSSFIDKDDRNVFHSHCSEVLKKHTPQTCEIRLRKKDGSGFYAHLQSIPIKGSDRNDVYCRTALSDISERKKSEGKIEHLASFPQLNPNPVIEIDLSGNITFCNPATQRILESMGMDKEEANVFLPKDLNVILESSKQKKELTLYREINIKDKVFGETIHLPPQFNVIRIYSLEITNRKQAEEALRLALAASQQRQAEVSALLAASRAVLEQHEFKETARNIFDSCKNLIGATAGYVALLSEDGTENEVLFLDSGGLPCTVDPSLPMPIRGLREVAYHTAKAVLENDFSHSKWVKFMPEGHTELGNVLFAPLVIQGKVIGLLGLANKTGGFTENDARIATTFGELAAISLHNSQLMKALQKSKNELESRVEDRTKDLVIERQRFYDVLETLPAYIILLTPDYHVRFANRIFRELFGESHGRRCFEFLFERSEPCEICETYRVLKTNKPHEWEWTGPNGRNYFIRDFPFIDTDGSTLILEMGIDITERKQAEENILRMNRLYSVLSKVNEAIVRIHEPEKLYQEICRIAVEDGLFKMAWIGVTDSETLEVKPVARFGDTGNYLDAIKIVAADVPEGRGPTGRSIREGKYFICSDIEHDPLMFPWRENALKHGFRSSAAFPLRAGSAVIGSLTIYSSQPQFFTREEINLLSSLVEDISFAIDSMANEKKRLEAESQIILNNSLLKLFSETFTRKEYLDSIIILLREWSSCRCIGIRMLDEHGNIPYESYTGFSKEFWEIENFLSINNDQCACIRVITEKPDPQDKAVLTPAGSFYSNNTLEFVASLTEAERARFRGTCIRNGFMSVSIIPIRYGKKVLGAIHIADEREGMVPSKIIESIESITPIIGEAIYRFDIEDDVRYSNELLEKVFSNIHVMIAYMDPEFNFIRVNRLYAEADKKEPEFFIGKNHFDLYPNEENKAIFRKVAATGEPYFAYARSFEYAEHPDRGITYWDWSLQPIKDAGGNVQGLVFSLIDVTDKVLLQAEAMHTAHLASLGELAAGVAHEINNPLNGIINYAQILSNKIEKESRENEIANRIIKEGDRIATIVKSLLSFARKRTEEKSVYTIPGILRDALLLTEAQILKESIKLKINMPEDLPGIIANSQQIQQVFLNVINNARYALNQKYQEQHEDKILEITGSEITIDGRQYARIIFYDKGSGIPADILDKVINPFFSTKPSGKGTGLGLSITHGIISDHGGNLKIESSEGEFTRIIIDLPAAVKRNRK